MGRQRDPDLKAQAVAAYRAARLSGAPKSLPEVASEFKLGEATLKRAHWRMPADGSAAPPHSVGGRPPRLSDAEVDAVVDFLRGRGRTSWSTVVAFVAERFGKSVAETTLRSALSARGLKKRDLEKQKSADASAPATHRYADVHRRKAPEAGGRRGYPSDMTDAEWVVLEPLLRVHATAVPQRHNARDVFNGIRYLLRTGCQWRYLPHEYPPWRTVQNWFQRWSKDGTFDKITKALREQVREADGRLPTPSAIIIDSQTAKKAEKGGPAATTRGKRSKEQSATSS
jgi:transposase